MVRRSTHAILLLFIICTNAFSGTTGKISGIVTEAVSGEPVVAANVYIEGTTLGAATDIEGFYVINNINPGVYNVTVETIGYAKQMVTNVEVNSDFTTKLNFQLKTEVMEGEVVVVEAERPMIRNDLTSSQTSINAAEIQALPVEDVGQLLVLQAGIIQGAGGELHIRGGRSTEIAYNVNGVSISNPYDNSRSVEVATNAIQELSVVSGTFNAEYGNALSGIVNTVTKEGGADLTGSVTLYSGDHLSDHTRIFNHIDAFSPVANYVSEFTLGGPVPGLSNYLTFFLSGRYENDEGYLYGKREHFPTDSVFKDPTNPNNITVASSGDNKYVPMQYSKDLTSTLKLTYKPSAVFKINYDVVFSNANYESYNHDFKYNPDANYHRYELGVLNSIEIKHILNPKTFYTLRGSYNFSDFKRYLYPLLDSNGDDVNYYPGLDYTDYTADPRYQPDHKLTPAAPFTFLAGGTQNGHFYQRTKTTGIKFDLTSQLDNRHELKFGMDYKYHELDFEDFDVLRDSVTNPVATIASLASVYHDRYSKNPVEFSAYVQDKMEFEYLVLNLGLRFDYFDAQSQYSTNTLYPSPYSATLPTTVDKNALLDNSSGKYQLSPRLGVSFKISEKGAIHFSYGHFFQMPPFQYLYTNPDFKYQLGAGTPTFGNANLNPEKTVTYELGLQQQFGDNLSLIVTGFYKDVRDLLAIQQIRISDDETYYRYVNQDYGNIKGIILSFIKQRFGNDLVRASLDYTFQVAEGNEVGADAFFIDTQSGRQSEKIPVYLSWDQSHTLNSTISLGRTKDWNTSVIGKFGTGLPYTPELFKRKVILRTNSERKPTQITVDLLAEKYFKVADFDVAVFLKVFNLFDTLNERLVYNDTGTADYSLEQTKSGPKATNELSERIPAVKSSDEYFTNPAYYLPPREVRLGLSFQF